MTDAERELRELLDTIPHEYVYGGAFAHATHHSQSCFHCKLETMLPRIESLILAERKRVRRQCEDILKFHCGYIIEGNHASNGIREAYEAIRALADRSSMTDAERDASAHAEPIRIELCKIPKTMFEHGKVYKVIAQRGCVDCGAAGETQQEGK